MDYNAVLTIALMEFSLSISFPRYWIPDVIYSIDESKSLLISIIELKAFEKFKRGRLLTPQQYIPIIPVLDRLKGHYLISFNEMI